MNPETVHDGPDPSNDTTGTLAVTHSEGDASELLLVATGGGREHGAGSRPEDVEDEADDGVALLEGEHGFLALSAANVADGSCVTLSFIGHSKFLFKFFISYI